MPISILSSRHGSMRREVFTVVSIPKLFHLPRRADTNSAKKSENESFQGVRHLSGRPAAEVFTEYQTQIERGDVNQQPF